MNLRYLNVTLTGKVLRWKLYLQDKDFHLYHVPGKEVHQQIPDALSRLCENNMPPKHVNPVGQLSSLQLEVGSSLYSNSLAEQPLPPQPGVAQPAIAPPKNRIAKPIYKKIAKVHNSMKVPSRTGQSGSIPDRFASAQSSLADSHALRIIHSK